ncbi:hypothetical protein OTB20_19625 [Streptomyces sp. H27-H1]|uniref:hypothetical protein n=1 Tax=Streptomyces sp. H27-H1 TaxID=2996461 RepID=UPI002271C9B2|nr:hypothetical protein [Streptomyces sp. H27-H1]MCY0928368.1 hypothetical protein [Streptomyces sp. H27-H1]
MNHMMPAESGDTNPEQLYTVAEASELLLSPQSSIARRGQLKPADRDLIAALDDHALWMILHHDECESDACTGCINEPAPTPEIARLDVPLAELTADLQMLALKRQAAADAKAGLLEEQRLDMAYLNLDSPTYPGFEACVCIVCPIRTAGGAA